MNKKRLRQFAGIAVAGIVGLAAAAPSFAADDADAAIKYRQAVMKAVGGHIGVLVSTLKGEIANKDGLAAAAAGFAAAASTSLTTYAFTTNTAGQGTAETTATAKIWEDFARFEEALVAMEKASIEIAAAAEAGELTSFDQLKPALKQCGFCHRESGFRQK